ncbi:MAG: beta-phosphoglucomutase [Defluviitaleaceae bacterium]|nr:beta-phosphoglucomutase [Defluviitaleaceae bacterium]MCL2274470.1 beta-phosphoglucomutase [Defluviitaleaceae bacterium]
MENIKGIIFDLDGVLVHTDELHYQAWKSIADKEGIFFDRTVNNRLRGVSRMESLDIILEKCDKTRSNAEKLHLATQKNDLYRTSLASLSADSVAQGVRSALLTLRERGYRLAIGSSSKNAEGILANTQLRDLFENVTDGNNISHSKPHPEVFLKAAAALGLSPAQCVVVEDARAGVDAAIDGGFVCFAMGDAADYPRADHKLNDFTDILEWLR